MQSPKLLEYCLDPEVRAFSSTRIGGVGVGTYSNFNITDYCGDQQEHVEKNRELLCEELSINQRQLILPHQVHGTDIVQIDDDFVKLNDSARKEVLYGKDAVVTSIPGLCIGVSTADCVPILLYDCVNKVSAAIHAGWRGTVGHIVSQTISYMKETFGSSGTDMKAIIGPSISLEAFEVGKEVYEAFRLADFPMDMISRFYPTAEGDVIHEGYKGRWHIDLWAANCLLLEDNGIPLQNIQVANVCTFATSDSFFSARKLGIQSGRIFSGIIIK